MAVIVRPLEEQDCEAFGRIFEEAYSEHLEFLKYENPQLILRMYMHSASLIISNYAY